MYTYEVGSVRKEEQKFEEATEQKRREDRATLTSRESRTSSESKHESVYSSESEDAKEEKKKKWDKTSVGAYAKGSGQISMDGSKLPLAGELHIICCVASRILNAFASMKF